MELSASVSNYRIGLGVGQIAMDPHSNCVGCDPLGVQNGSAGFYGATIKGNFDWMPLKWGFRNRNHLGLTADLGKHTVLNGGLTGGLGVAGERDLKGGSSWFNSGWHFFGKGTVDYYNISGGPSGLVFNPQLGFRKDIVTTGPLTFSFLVTIGLNIMLSGPASGDTSLSQPFLPIGALRRPLHIFAAPGSEPNAKGPPPG